MRLTTFGKIMMTVLMVACGVLLVSSWAIVEGATGRAIWGALIGSFAVAALLAIAFHREERRHDTH